MTVITLTSDFGLLDSYVGIMKGVILSIAPDARLVDLTHNIPQQDIDAAVFALQSAIPYFPPGTVHLAVVDPGVGSARRPLLVTTGRAAFVGPDNGLFSFALGEPGGQAWVLDRPQHWLPEPSRTFHGRDIFAPVAAHLALGMLPANLGTPIINPVLLPLRTAERTGNGEIRGYVLNIDYFGNLITNVPGEWLAGARWSCEMGDTSIKGPSETYAAVEAGELLLLISSAGLAEVAVRDGSAAERLRVGRGAPVIFRTS
jgi:S-adenosyl-L-methionine hydrolase (adenosine-forming)